MNVLFSNDRAIKGQRGRGRISHVDHPLRRWSAPGGVLPGIGAKVRLAPRTPRPLRTRGPIRCTCGGHAGMNRHGGGTPRWRPRASAREGPSAPRTSRGWLPTPGRARGGNQRLRAGSCTAGERDVRDGGRADGGAAVGAAVPAPGPSRPPRACVDRQPVAAHAR